MNGYLMVLLVSQITSYIYLIPTELKIKMHCADGRIGSFAGSNVIMRVLYVVQMSNIVTQLRWIQVATP